LDLLDFRLAAIGGHQQIFSAGFHVRSGGCQSRAAASGQINNAILAAGQPSLVVTPIAPIAAAHHWP
jgi:hypothetical protein